MIFTLPFQLFFITDMDVLNDPNLPQVRKLLQSVPVNDYMRKSLGPELSIIHLDRASGPSQNTTATHFPVC